MSELKPYIGPHPTDRTLTEYYLKSEADKVIAELEDKILQYTVLYKEKYRDINTQERFFAQERAHDKYKRCLAMARWCEATALWCYQASNTLPAGFHATLYGKRVMIEPDRLFKRHVLLTKWITRWREIADKFKETK